MGRIRKITKVMAEAVTPTLGCDALQTYLSLGGTEVPPAEVWSVTRDVFETAIKSPPERWTTDTPTPAISGLGFSGRGEGESLVRSIMLTTLGTLYRAIESGVPVDRHRVEELAEAFGKKFDLPDTLAGELGRFLGTWSQGLEWEYLVFTFKPGSGREKRPVGLEEGQSLRGAGHERYDFFFFEPGSEIYYQACPISIPSGSYEYDILVLLLEQVEESWEVSKLIEKLADAHEVFRDGRSLVEDRPKRIKGQWQTLVGNLRKRLDRRSDGLGKSLTASAGRIGIKGIGTSCLVLGAKSKYL